MKKQVDQSHYEFSRYMTKPRWASVWHQLDEVIKLKPKRVLEIGPGPGVFKAAAKSFGVNVETLDIDPDLNPDYVASVFGMPFADNEIDVVCAFQMLEHIPYTQSLIAFKEMARVAKTGIVISLPDAKILWPMSVYLPKLGEISFAIPRPRLRAQANKFDAQHYWEINKVGFPLSKIIKELSAPGWELTGTFRVAQNPYHRFFVYKPSRQ